MAIKKEDFIADVLLIRKFWSLTKVVYWETGHFYDLRSSLYFSKVSTFKIDMSHSLAPLKVHCVNISWKTWKKCCSLQTFSFKKKWLCGWQADPINLEMVLYANFVWFLFKPKKKTTFGRIKQMHTNYQICKQASCQTLWHSSCFFH